ncbi:MAG: LysE family transporter [Flavobacteriaceae bacterium]|nr:LysE family transporter [Flavobacteriaceae bacterium]
MLDFGLIAAVGLIHMVALVSPGPDFVVACRNTLMYSRSIGIYTAVGFGLGICVHISYAVFGLSWLIANNELIFTVIQYLGAFYLILIGIQSLRSFQSQIGQETVSASSRISPFRAVRIGFITNVLNPKATLFFLSLFSTMLNPTVGKLTLVVIAVLLVVTTILWFSLVALLISHPRFTTTLKRYEKTVHQFFGVLLIGIGGIILIF